MTDRGLAEDYAGPFEENWSLERLTRRALARLCREYMVVSMYHDRALMPHVALTFGQEATIRQADSEWMGSSPIYTERNKKNLNIVGDGASEALKSFQFDVGAPHHFLDFHFQEVDHDLGVFWLPFCGAHHYLRELTANDEQLVVNMCHHMEDRIFDATLAATNPRLRAIPVHRPPKPDEFTGDHCRWEVRVVDEEPGPRPGEPSEEVVRQSAAAGFEFDLGESLEAGGMDDYSGPLRPDFRLEDLSHAVLVRQAKEFALDVHLLMRAAYFSIDENFSPELLDDAAPQHRAAMAPVMVERLCEAMGITGDGMETIAKVLQLDPILVDDYVRYSVAVHDDANGSIEFHDCAGIGDDVCRSPLDWLDGFVHMAQAVNPRCRAAQTGERSWDLHIDPEAEQVEPHWLADGIGGGGLRTFDLSERRVELNMKPS